MKCPFCGKETVTDSAFCGSCGKRLETVKQTVFDEKPPSSDFNPQEAPSIVTSPNESEKTDTATPPETNPQNINNPPPQNYGNWLPPTPVKKSYKKKAIIVSIIAVVLVIIIIAGMLIMSAFAGPVTTIAKAFDKTTNCGSFNFEVEVNADGQTVNLKGTVIYDLEERILELYAEADTSFGDKATVVLKDGMVVTDEGDRIDDDDIEDELDEFFDAYDDYKNELKKEEIDWEELFETLYIDDDVIDYELFGEAFNAFVADLNDPDYINEYLGEYTKERKDGSVIHSFDINTEKLSDELTSVFGDALDIDNDRTPEISYTTYNSYSTTSEYNEPVTGDSIAFGFLGGENFELKFTTTSGYLSGFSFDAENAFFEISLSEFGDAEIDEAIFEEYDEYLD